MMLQNTYTKWINNKPVVYFPWQPDFVSQSIHHELRTDLPPHIEKKKATFLKSRPHHWAE